MPLPITQSELENLVQYTIQEVLKRVSTDYPDTIKAGFSMPLDYENITLPVVFEKYRVEESTGLAIPAPEDRMGYRPDDANAYLEWGKYDHDELCEVLKKYSVFGTDLSILDFGCSTGRILRHFNSEKKSLRWKLYGCDIQARVIEWIRQHLPNYFNVLTCSTIPHLPYADNTFDFIYGFSVFTHIKYQWDAWLMELRRVMKHGGIMMQTVHTENAWEYYASSNKEEWIRNAHTPRVYEYPKMDVDYLLHGDMAVSQVFWKKETTKKYWERYFEVLEIRDPPKHSFQDWVIVRK